jgi:hypothetical protein
MKSGASTRRLSQVPPGSLTPLHKFPWPLIAPTKRGQACSDVLPGGCYCRLGSPIISAHSAGSDHAAGAILPRRTDSAAAGAILVMLSRAIRFMP